MAVATLAVRISAQLAEFQKAFADTSKGLNKFHDEFQGVATKAAAVGVFLGNVFTKLASSIASGIGSAISDAIRLSSEFSNAFLGLGSVANAFGADVKVATDAAKRLSSDGLLPLKDSATGLKNLLAAGFNLDQSVKLMNAFKDSAAFGRQGALSFGDAVRSATEGVKNGNSILVDNAGITKNLSVILKEAGFSAQDLSRASSDAGVRMALFNGILKEASAQTGDAAKLTLTYTGQVSRLTTSYEGLLGKLGDTITQNKTVAAAIGALSDVFQKFIDWIATHGPTAFTAVSDAVITFVRILSGVVKAIDFVQQEFNILDSAIKSSVKGIADAVKAVGELLINILVIASKLPGSSAALKIAADEIRSLVIVTGEAGAISRRMGSDIAANTTRMEAWGSTLGGASKFLDNLATNLVETRGKTVSFGAATTTARAGTAGLGDEVGKLSAEAKKAAKALDTLQDRISGRTAVEEAKRWGTALKSIGGDFSRLTAKDIKEFDAALTEVKERFGSLEKAGVGSLSAIHVVLKALSEKAKTLDLQLVQSLGPQTLAAIATKAHGGPQMILPIVPEISQDSLNTIGRQFERAFIDWKARFLRFKEDIKDIGLTAVRGFAEAFAIGIRTGDWSQLENNLKDVLANALGNAAAAAVDLVVPGLGTALQPIFSALADKLLGALGLGTKGRDAVKAFAATFGGFDALRKKLSELGAEGERLWRTLTQGVGRNNPQQAQAAIDAITAALDRQEQAWRDIGRVIDAANKRAEIFGRQFSGIADPAKLAEIAQRTQPEFERLGIVVAGVFAAMVRHSGDAIGAINALGPSFELLKKGVNEFGLTSTATIDQLIANFDLLNNEAFKPLFEQIQAMGQILDGLDAAKALDPVTFQAIAADIGQSIQEIVNRGGDMARTLALSQPILQRLWEAQQTYGRITDDTTQSILEQAHQQGLVGAHMKDVNQKILDVLLAIGRVLGADLPAYFDKLAGHAQGAADGISDAFSRIDVPTVKIPFEFVGPDAEGVPHLSAGGIVRRRTLAVIGESGPEAVVPLSQLGHPSGTTTIIIETDGRAFAEMVVPYIPGEVRRYELA